MRLRFGGARSGLPLTAAGAGCPASLSAGRERGHIAVHLTLEGLTIEVGPLVLREGACFLQLLRRDIQHQLQVLILPLRLLLLLLPLLLLLRLLLLVRTLRLGLAAGLCLLLRLTGLTLLCLLL